MRLTPARGFAMVAAMDIEWVQGGMSYVVFLFSTTCHEAAHAWSALKLGDDTAARGGQVTLDPTPHIKREPLGMVVVPILSFLAGGGMLGWASAPYDPHWALRYPRRAAWMALAGPAANLTLFFIALLLMHAGQVTGVFETPSRCTFANVIDATGGGFWPFIAGMLSLLFSMNLLLFVFNLIPLPPLDGAAIPLLALPEETAARYLALRGGLGFVGLFIAWKLFDLVFPSIWRAALVLLPGRTGVF